MFLAADVILLTPWAIQYDCGDGIEGTTLGVLAIMIAYKLIWLLAGVLVAFKSRVISISRFQERQQLGYAIYNIAFSIFIFLPVSFLFADEIVAVYVVRCVGLMLITTFTLAVVMVPKFYHIYWMRGNDSRHLSKDGDDTNMDMPSLNRGMSGEPGNRSVSRTLRRDESWGSPTRNPTGLDSSRTSPAPNLYRVMTPDSPFPAGDRDRDREGMSGSQFQPLPPSSSAASSLHRMDSLQPGDPASRWSIHTANQDRSSPPGLHSRIAIATNIASDIELHERLSPLQEVSAEASPLPTPANFYAPPALPAMAVPPRLFGFGVARPGRVDRSPSLEGPILSSAAASSSNLQVETDEPLDANPLFGQALPE